MAVLTARRRLVTFRLTNEEFEALRRTCEVEGWRSISDFAREAVMQRVESHRSVKVLLTEDLKTLSTRLEDLDHGLVDLRTRIAKVLGSSRTEVE
jgi:hypothetical protein